MRPERPFRTADRSSSTDSRYGWALAAGAALLLVAGALTPPFVEGTARVLVRKAFAPVCHQMPSRSFAVAGVPLAVCHRCFGIYAGLLAGVLAWPLGAARLKGWIGRHAGGLVVVAGTPAAVDWTLGVTGLWTNTTFTQTATGALLGAALGLALARAATQAADPHAKATPPTSSPPRSTADF